MHQFLKNLKNANTWLSWWRHQMMTKVTFVNFFYQGLFHITNTIYVQRYSTFFHRLPTRLPTAPHQSWDFQKSPAQVGLKITQTIIQSPKLNERGSFKSVKDNVNKTTKGKRKKFQNNEWKACQNSDLTITIIQESIDILCDFLPISLNSSMETSKISQCLTQADTTMSFHKFGII